MNFILVTLDLALAIMTFLVIITIKQPIIPLLLFHLLLHLILIIPDCLHVYRVDHEQLLSFVRLGNHLDSGVTDDLLLEELLLLLLCKLLKTSRCKLILSQVRHFNWLYFSQKNRKPQVIVLVISQRTLKLAVLSTVIFGL